MPKKRRADLSHPDKIHWQTYERLPRARPPSRQEAEAAKSTPIQRLKVGRAGEILTKGKIIPKEEYPISFEESLYLYNLPKTVGSMGFLNFKFGSSINWGKYLAVNKIHIPCTPINYRRLGLAKEFLEEAEKIAREQGCEHIVGTISAADQTASNLLKKSGYVFETVPRSPKDPQGQLFWAKKRLRKS